MGLTITSRLNEEGDNYDGWNNYDPKVDPLGKDSENTVTVLHRLHGQCQGRVIVVDIFSSLSLLASA